MILGVQVGDADVHACNGDVLPPCRMRCDIADIVRAIRVMRVAEKGRRAPSPIRYV
jgi:hypothetical protein